MDTLHSHLSPKQAIEAGFKLFNEFFQGSRKMHVLLEGLELDDYSKNWLVTIGFDTGRSKDSGNDLSVIGIGQKTTEPLREFRILHINAETGEFVKMERA